MVCPEGGEVRFQRGEVVAAESLVSADSYGMEIKEKAYRSRTRLIVPTPQLFAIWMTAVPTALLAPFWITHCFLPLRVLFGGEVGSRGMKSESMRSAVGGLIASVAAWTDEMGGVEETRMRDV